MTIKNKFSILILSIALILPLAARAQNRDLVQDGESQTQKRVALVIGNADYTSARKLVNPANDANDMAKTLREVGFEVISGTNLSLKQMTDKVREFGDKLKVSGGVGLFYYAGHGVQVNNRNYLIPVEADITREDEIDFAALNFDQVLRKMATANNGLNIVILDACRNNPFARSWSRGADEGGLAQISAPTGTFIAYATSPDKTANDGTGRNGLYTAELLKFIKQPNLTIEETFKEVRKAVKQASNDKQVPWDSSSLSGDFYFNNSLTKKSAESRKPVLTQKPPTETKTPANNALSDDEVLWNAIKDDRNPQNFAEFIKTFPKSKHVAEAQQLLNELKQQAEVSPNSSATSSIKITTAAAGKGKGFELISIYLFDTVAVKNVDGAAEVEVIINDVNVTSKIKRQMAGVVNLQGKTGELNFKIGRNEVYVIVNGVKSEVYVFKQFE